MSTRKGGETGVTGPRDPGERLLMEVGRQIGGRFSTAVVLFHSAVAARVGLNVTDYKCADILFRAGPMHPGRLAELTGMSTAATAQVLARLERAGLIRREPDPTDRRRTVVHPMTDSDTYRELSRVFADFGGRVAAVMSRYDEAALRVIADFVTEMTETLETEAIRLRTRAAHGDPPAQGREPGEPRR